MTPKTVDFSREKLVKARKNHQCYECRRVISMGEQYFYTTYGIDGDISQNKRCQHCNIAAKWLIKHCNGYVFGGIQSELEEHYFEGYCKDNLARLVVGMRRKWAAFQDDGLLPIPSFL